MKAANIRYDPVYHFTDDRLFKAFIADIPRSQLVAHIRNDERLRKRCFPGFRITNAYPTQRQIDLALKSEIVERHNGKLASALCADWIASRSQLAATALKTLGIQSETPRNANSWIGAVQTAIAKTTNNELYSKLVRGLIAQFSNDDIHIFASLISYGRDQDSLQQTIEQEILNSNGDPSLRRERLLATLLVEKAKASELEQRVTEIKISAESKSKKAQEALNARSNDHKKLLADLAQADLSLASVTKQLSDIKRQVIEYQRSRDTKQKQELRLSEEISRAHNQLLIADANSKKEILEADQLRRNQESYVVELSTELDSVCKQLLAAEQERNLAIKHAAVEHAITVNLNATAQDNSPTLAVPQSESFSSIEQLGNNAICYQGLQRIFRNAVVTFLRDRMVQLYPKDHISRIAKCFGNDWNTAAMHAAHSRANLGTMTTVRDEYDLLGTNHFFNIFEAFYDKLFSVEAGQNPDSPKPVKPRFIGNLKAIKDGRDPLSHPVEEDVSFDEAHHLLYAGKEVLMWLGCDQQSAELSKLASLIGPHGQETLLRRLPSEDSIYQDWVGRTTLLGELTTCFSNPDGKRCVLAGDGGKGKSAVAYRFAQSVTSQLGRYHLVIWLSAKRRRFREGAPTTIESPDFTSANEAIDRLLTEYGATAQDMSKDSAERKRLLFEYLDEFPAFIIADDIDSVLEDDEVVSLFTHEIPHSRSSVLATSRRAIPGIKSFIVPGFDIKESEEFVKSRVRLYSLSATDFTPSVIKEIAKATDGLPLFMDDLMRLTKVVDIRSAIRMWSEKGGDEARKYALQREIEQLSRDAKRCLIAAAVAEDSISFAELENIAELSEDRLVSALAELNTLFLFPKAPVVEGEQRYQINTNTKKLVRLVEGPSEFYKRIENRSRVIAGKLPDAGRSLIGSLIRQALLRVNAEQHAEAETILLGAIEKYPNSADLHGILGFAYKRVGRLADARRQFEFAFKAKSTNPEMFLHWQKMEIAEKEWSKALAVADRALKILPGAYEIVERKVYTLRQAGFDLHRGLIIDKAKKMWTDAVDEVTKQIKDPATLSTGARSLNASMYHSIVICLDMLIRFEDRNYWLSRWEKEHPDDPQVAIQKEYLKRKRGSL